MALRAWQNRDLTLNINMHETLFPPNIGNIDSVELINNSLKITGWYVDVVTNEHIKSHLFTVFGDTHITECGVFLLQRPDVANFYKNNSGNYIYSGFEIVIPARSGELTIKYRNETIFKVTGKKYGNKNLDEIIQLNLLTKPELIVVDNFYKDPDIVREYALEQEFKANEAYHKGSRTQKSYIPSWAKAEFSRLLNKEVKEFVGATGVFQYCIAKDNVVYHYDTQEYAAMVYLTPNAPLQTGTQTYRSKRTGLFAAATDADAARLNMPKEQIDFISFNGNNFYDRHNMELVDSVANVYNRLVIFNARALHAATSYFGDTKENARLFHLYFFNC